MTPPGAAGDPGRVCVGIDLAWGPNGRTGLAAVDGTGRLVASTSVRTDEEIDAWLAAVGPLAVAGIDAPIVVTNEGGARSAERAIAAAWARFHAGPHPTNRRTRHMDPPRALRLADRHGWTIRSDGATDRPLVIEVYPHPAMVALFELDAVVPYKRRGHRAFPERRAQFARLLGLIEGLPELALARSPDWAGVRARVDAAVRLVDLDRVEDEIDAVFCAHLAWLWAARPGALVPYGDWADGAIVAPPPRA